LEGKDPLNSNLSLPQAIAECRTLFYTPEVTNSPRQIRDHIEEGKMQLRGLVGKASHDPKISKVPNYAECCELIIVDEADRLKMQSLEQLRDLYDQGDFGMILVGMPSLEKRLVRYPQFYSASDLPMLFGL